MLPFRESPQSRHAAPRPGFQGLHERGLNDVLDEGETAHAERPAQHGAEPAKLVAKRVLHQRAVRSWVAGRFADLDRRVARTRKGDGRTKREFYST
jgi:hypothetical protein